MIIKLLFGWYVALRVSQACEIGAVIYLEVANIDLAAVLVFVFLFGVAVVLIGATQLGERVAITWHVILEILLVPISVDFAFHAALAIPRPGSLLAHLSAEPRFIVMLIFFLAGQCLLAIAGLHVVRWISKK